MSGKNKVSTVASQNPSQINEDVRIRGTITVPEPLVMAGQLDGDVNADTLYVASMAIITRAIVDFFLSKPLYTDTDYDVSGNSSTYTGPLDEQAINIRTQFDF